MATGSSLDGRQYQLNERTQHTTVAIDDSLYLWCGDQPDLPVVHDNQKKRRVASDVQIFSLSSGKWTTHVTKGTPPLGVMGYTCSAVTDKLYYFGGYCGHDNCCHNSVNQLDTGSLTWTELEPTANDRPVMRRAAGGMITIECDGVHQLLMIGGVGSPLTTQLPQANYIKLSDGGRWRTNEHSLYNISTGKWSNPSITGECIPPASDFVIEKINNSRAIVFGGLVKSTISNSVYLIEISGSTVYWQRLKKPADPIDQWPVGRCAHAATIITGSVSPILVTIGGQDRNLQALNECWLFDIISRSWTKITLPDTVSERWAHSLSVFVLGSHRIWIVIVGGFDKNWDFIEAPNNTVLVELVLTDTVQWSVGDILDSSALSTERYQQKYLQQLKSERSQEWLEQYQKPREGDMALMRELQQLREQREREKRDADQQLEEKEREKERILELSVHQLQDKEKELAQSQQVLQSQVTALQEKESYIARLTRKLHSSKERESEADVQQQQQLTTTSIHSIQEQQQQVTTSESSESSDQQLVQYKGKLSIDDVPKLSAVLQPVDSNWYQLGQSLGVEESLLIEMKQKGDSTADEQMKCLLEIWLNMGEKRTVAQLEMALKEIGRDDILSSDLHQLVSSDTHIQKDFNWFQLSKLAVKKIVDMFGGYHYWLFLSIIVPLLLIILSFFFTVQPGELMYINKTVTGGIADSIVWPHQLFKMEIPPDSFPYTHSVDISVSLDPSHRLQAPKGYKSISPTYKITASEKLQKPVLLTLKHNGVIRSNEEAKSVAVLHQSEERSTVEILQGTAAINSSYVVFQLTELSWIKIIGAVTMETRYWMSFYRHQASDDGQYWNICILLSHFGNKVQIKGSVNSCTNFWKYKDWMPDDIEDKLLIINNTRYELEVHPFGCWAACNYTTNVTIKVDDAHGDIARQFKMEWKLDCTSSLSLIRLNNSNVTYDIFENPDINTGWWKYHVTKDLDIRNLVNVIDKLHQCNFSSSKWKQLGLQLGLYKNTLDGIETKCHERSTDCLTECLSAWLNRQDNTDGEGGANWSSLKNALMDIDRACADRIN